MKAKNVKVLSLLYLPGPLNMAFIVPDVNACSLFTMNSWPSEDINFTYIASGPSHPPYVFSSPSIMEKKITVSEHNILIHITKNASCSLFYDYVCRLKIQPEMRQKHFAYLKVTFLK